ncbi:MAG: type VI secretion system contractile sheath large subunit [bacterium]
MSNDPRSEVHLTSDFATGASAPVSDGVFRIALLGDFSGRSSRKTDASGAPLAKRRARRVDRDDVDAVIAAMNPEVHVTIDPAEPPVAIRFRALDDFHPDQLVERVALFQQLRALKRASAEGGSAPAPVRPAPQATRRADSAALGLSSGSLLDRIVDNDPSVIDATDQIRGIAPQDELTEFVDRAVRPHTVREPSREQRDVAAKVDDAVGAMMRVVLHHPDFQALEALWRGVDFLVRRLDTSESLQVVLIDVSQDEIVADLRAEPDNARTGLSRVLAESGARGSIVVGAYTFGPDHVDVLSRLASIGRSVDSPWLSAADPRLAGAVSFTGETDPDDWDIPVPTGWDALRRSADASFLGLALPRFLLREPYGKKTDACSFPFEEMAAGAPDHESFLWGNAAIVCALVVGDSVGAGDDPATQATVDRLPLYVATIDGEAVATPCTEALVTHSAVAHMLDRGLTPLASPRDGDVIIISRLQSVATPPRPLSIASTSRN